MLIQGNKDLWKGSAFGCVNTVGRIIDRSVCKDKNEGSTVMPWETIFWTRISRWSTP